MRGSGVVLLPTSLPGARQVVRLRTASSAAYPPREVAVLMARILDPEPGQTVYDSNCGSAGLLIKTHLRLVEKCGVRRNGATRLPAEIAPLRPFGQEINAATFAMARKNAVIHDMEAEIALGDTMAAPKFTNADGLLRRFHLIPAKPRRSWTPPTRNWRRC